LTPDFSKTRSVHPTENGCLTLFRAGEGKGGEEEEWRPTSVSPLPIQVGTLAATSPTQPLWTMGTILPNQHIISFAANAQGNRSQL